jgi:hypothetical protein
MSVCAHALIDIDPEADMLDIKNTKLTVDTHGQRRTRARLAMLALAGAMVVLFIPMTQSPARAAGMQTKDSLANFDGAGNLKRPVGYREWIFIGTPLTPNDMNDGKAAFPEFHNVYLDPKSWAYWKKHGEFRDGTIITKELVSVGSKSTFSGKGYFEGEYLGLEAMVKDSKRFPDAPGNWAFFRFTNDNYQGLKTQAAALPDKDCNGCHKPNAAQDSVFIQHYPVLRAGKSAGAAAAGGL